MTLPQSILVYRIGALGDTLVSLPALWALRAHFVGARITLLCDARVRGRYVLATDLLKDSGVVDDFMVYPVDHSPRGQLLRPLRMARLLMSLRRKRFDTVAYLAPSQRTVAQVERDRKFFRAAGITCFLGMDGFGPPRRNGGGALATSPREADLLLARLAASNVPIPPPDRLRIDLGLTQRDEAAVSDWLTPLPPDDRRRWVAIGPGSKMPAKIWPAERFETVVRRLIEQHDVWPVVFGGGEDQKVGDELLHAWGRGYNAAGQLGLRAAAAALGRCALYLGNDTGTMHLAASAGVPCVALFSSRSAPGQWYPYGSGHQVFRTPIDCEGCMLEVCVERGMECLLRISPTDVFAACSHVLTVRMPRALAVTPPADVTATDATKSQEVR